MNNKARSKENNYDEKIFDEKIYEDLFHQIVADPPSKNSNSGNFSKT